MPLGRSGRQRIVLGLAALLAGIASSQPRAAPRQQPTPDDRARFMQGHFASVMSLHAAVIRGDLAESHRIAADIAARGRPPGVNSDLQPYVADMQAAARKLSADSTLRDAAVSTATMLAACGDCHRAAGTMPALPPAAAPAVGGSVGHMLVHQRAVDLIVQGLTVPSTSAWKEGTDLLSAAPLRSDKLPSDPKLTDAVRTSELQVHELVDRSRRANDTGARIGVYSELMQTCANCHSLHHTVWGPGRER